MMTNYDYIKRLLVPAVISAVLAGCSGGSGEGVQQNPPPEIDTGNIGIVYNGPAPASDDVQNFKLNVWDNLAGSDRCGACHIDGGESPMFVRADDINLAYAAVNDIVDLSAPALSEMVTQVAGGHNCWRPESGVCADIITNYIENWANASGAEATEVVLTPPPEIEVKDSKSFPSDVSETNFATTVYPLLEQYCSSCHSEESDTQQQPFLGSSDLDVAYQAAKNRMNIDTPALSRLVTRLGEEFHSCWSGSCTADAQRMEDEITAFAELIPVTEVDDTLMTSRALGLPDGIIAATGGRFDSNAIALYEFKTGTGSVAFDTSGIDPALDLNIIGNVEWVGSWGIRINDGKAQGATSASAKLHSMIQATGEFSIEAWVVPDNVAQDGPARIVTYSGGDATRNFTLGQTTYDYNFLARHTDADANGMPMLSTPSAAEILQATLQHVVVNFDPIDGRSIYVNGELVARNDTQPGNLNDWDDTFAFAVGSEVDNDNLWMGTMRLLAIHNRVLSEEEIVNNFEVGVGEKFFLLFGISHLVDVPEAYVVFEVQQFDNYSYLFNTPFFVSLDNTATIPEGFTIRGLRIGLNGRETPVGQAFANLDLTIDPANYTAGSAYPLSELGALVPIDKGPDDDQFFLTFDRIADTDTEFVREENVPAPPAEVPAGEQSDIGVRTFDEVNAALSSVTTVPATTPAVAAVFETVRQQLPTVESAEAFLSSHQSGVMQLSVAYCNALVNDASLRSAYFPGFDFSASYAAAFPANESLIIQPLMRRLLAADIDDGSTVAPLASTADPVETEANLSQLISAMSASDTRTTVISTCAAAMGSALMLVQ